MLVRTLPERKFRKIQLRRKGLISFAKSTSECDSLVEENIQANYD